MQIEVIRPPEQGCIRSDVLPVKAGLHPLVRMIFGFPVLLCSFVVTVTVFTVSFRFNDPDLWWNLKLGQIIATAHSIPATDLLSFPAFGSPLLSHEWLGELTIYWAYAVGGYTGLMLWVCIFGSLIFALVFVLCWRQTNNAPVAFLGGMIAWFFGTIGLAIRPLILAHLFLVSELLILHLARTKDRRWFWCLPPLFALWVNCHASYYFGIAILGVCWICSHVNGRWGLITSEAADQKQRVALGLSLLGSTFALCLNPGGVPLLLFPLKAMFGSWFQHAPTNAIEEFLPPQLGDLRAIGLIAVIVGVLLITLVRNRELHLEELLLILMTFALAIRHTRMMFLFGIVASPTVCRLLSLEFKGKPKQDHPFVNAGLLFVVLAVIIWSFPNTAAIQKQVRAGLYSPAGAVEFIKSAGLQGPMLNSYVFGGYLIWALPEQRVFIDGRGTTPEVMTEYGRWITLAEDPRILLDKYRIRFCVLTKDAPIVQVIPFLPGWSKVYSDNVAVVFAR